MHQDDLSYPVICLGRDGSVISHFSSATMSACNARALWTTRYFEDLTVIDSEACVWRVSAVEPASDLSAAAKFIARFTNRKLQVRLRIERMDKSSNLEDAKQVVADWVDRDPVFWEASADVADWKSRVKECDSMRELARLFV